MPTAKVREAAKKTALAHDMDERWLNDGVKAFLSPHGTYEPFLSLSNLSIFCARAEYLLAMKCLSMRIGEEFHDLSDVQYLLRNLNIRDYEGALEIIGNYYPLEKFPPKTLSVLRDSLKA